MGINCEREKSKKLKTNIHNWMIFIIGKSFAELGEIGYINKEAGVQTIKCVGTVFIIQATPAALSQWIFKSGKSKVFENKGNKLYWGAPLSNPLRGDQAEINNVTGKKQTGILSGLQTPLLSSGSCEHI